MIVLNLHHISVIIVPFGSYYRAGKHGGDNAAWLGCYIGIWMPYRGAIFLCNNAFYRRKKMEPLYLRYLLRS